jgi:hypothetical protein
MINIDLGWVDLVNFNNLKPLNIKPNKLLIRLWQIGLVELADLSSDFWEDVERLVNL